jgi:hypothetical protein
MPDPPVSPPWQNYPPLGLPPHLRSQFLTPLARPDRGSGFITTVTASDTLAAITDVVTEVNEPISALQDSFTAANGSNPNNNVWQYFGISPTVISIQSNQLSVAIAASDTHYGGVTSQLSFNLVNSAVFVQAVSAGNQSLASLEYYPLQLFDAPILNTLFFYINGGILYSFVRVNTTTGGSRVTATYSPTTHAWFRIREASGTVYFETSPDGVTWSVFDSLADPFSAATMGALRVQMAAGTYANEVSSTTCAWDSVNTSGSVVNNVTASDSLAAISDTATRSAQALTRTGTDALSTVTDTATRSAQALTRSSTDSLSTITDTSTRTVGHPRSLADSLTGISDTATRAAQAFNRSSTDSLSGVGDTPTRTVGHPRSLTDSLTAISDAATRSAQALTRSATESLAAITDVATRGGGNVRTASDALSSISDVATRAVTARTRSGADSLAGISDAATRSAQAFTRSGTDPLTGITEAPSRTVGHPRSLADSLSPLTDVAGRANQSIIRSSTDALSGITDVPSRIIHQFRYAIDSVAALTDVATFVTQVVPVIVAVRPRIFVVAVVPRSFTAAVQPRIFDVEVSP